MVWIIARKEFLLNLVNFRFIAGFILCFMLSVLSAWILTQDYAERILCEYFPKHKHGGAILVIKLQQTTG